MRLFLAFVAVLAFAAGCDTERSSFGNAARGRELVERYRCQACHTVPGIAPVPGATAPSLARLDVPPATLAAYLQNPRISDPSNTMPDLDIPPEDARDLAAFLMTLR